MELLKLSKFKLQLQAVISEVRDLRERERLAADKHHHGIEKQKQAEEEYNRKIQDLQAELASVKEERQKLERKVNYLQNDNTLLENKQKELKDTIHNLLQSRENFVHAYEETTSAMRRSIETKDRKLSVLSEKINAHLLLFNSIEKEALSIKQIVDNVQSLVTEREKIVAGLKIKIDAIPAFEKTFVESISELRNKLENHGDELRRKDKVISELEAKLDVAKLSNNGQAQIEDLQKTLVVKDAMIQNLISDKEVLHYEIGSLRLVLQRVWDVVTNMSEEDKRLFCSVLQQKEATGKDSKVEQNRVEDMVQNKGEKDQELPGSLS